MKKVLNFFGIVLAVLFSLALIPTLILNPVWRGVSGLLQPEVLEDLTVSLVEEIDLSDISLDSPELAQALAESGISPEAAQALLSSQAAEEILTLVGQDFTHVVKGDFAASALTETEVLRIVDANRAELIQVIRLAAPAETATLTDDQMDMVLDSSVQELLPMLADLDQSLLDMQTDLHSGEIGLALDLATGPMIPTILLVASLVLAVLIFLCRWPQQKGLLWLGIDSAIAALPVLGMAISLKGAQLSEALAQTAGIPNVFAPVLHRMGNITLIGGAILLVIAIVLIAAFILLRDRRMKKLAAHPDYAPTAPAVEAAPAAPMGERSPWDNV